MSAVHIHEVIPYLRLKDAAHAIEFYKRAFDAIEVFRMTEPIAGGRIGHAEILIGGVKIMLADEHPEYGIRGPETVGGTTFAIHLHVDNVDALVEQAVQTGAAIIRPVENHFHGERGGVLRDPFGHEWLLGQEIEKVSKEEMQERYAAMFQG